MGGDHAGSVTVLGHVVGTFVGEDRARAGTVRQYCLDETLHEMVK
jgi:hypothetical protein